FRGGAGFQWINPKAWAVTTGAAATFLPDGSTPVDIGIASVVLALSAITTLFSWAAGGSVLRGVLQVPRYATIFNLAAAALLLLSVVALLIA
ncbi:MAG: LysE family translocator, partial [Pseudomonadota bacterium]